MSADWLKELARHVAWSSMSDMSRRAAGLFLKRAAPTDATACSVRRGRARATATSQLNTLAAAREHVGRDNTWQQLNACHAAWEEEHAVGLPECLLAHKGPERDCIWLTCAATAAAETLWTFWFWPPSLPAAGCSEASISRYLCGNTRKQRVCDGGHGCLQHKHSKCCAPTSQPYSTCRLPCCSYAAALCAPLGAEHVAR